MSKCMEKTSNFAAPLSDIEGVGIARAPLGLGKNAVPEGENLTQGKRLPESRFIVRKPGNRMEHSHKQPKSIIKKRIKK